jgi:MYXO-CTERM domain-containing protein
VAAKPTVRARPTPLLDGTMNHFVLTLLHFNLQYVAGGLEGVFPGAGFDEAGLEDAIIDESFEPVLDMLDAHPTWSVDLELQSYMVEVMAARRPQVLAHLKALADAGQVEIVSFTYSDQLWVAYPWRDQQASLELTRRIFEENGLPLGTAVFTQEGQFGPGMVERMPDFGYGVAVLPHNLAEYFFGGPYAHPVYRASNGVTVLIGGGGGQGVTEGGDAYQVDWHFMDDGELYATGDADPYLGPVFKYNAEAMQKRIDDLIALEDSGAQIVSIGAFSAAIGTPPDALPPVGDGTWQPDDTGNVHRWMGGLGLWSTTEQDNHVITANTRAGQVVAAAGVIAGAEAVEPATKALLLGEVSDSSGWNPMVTEVAYGLDHAAEAERLALQAIEGACAEQGATGAVVHLSDGTVTWDGALADEPTDPIDAPFALATTGRPPGVTWTAWADDVDAVEVAWTDGYEATSVAFPWDGLTVATVPALSESVQTTDAADLAGGHPVLPLATGLVRLSDGLWLVERTTSVHLAAHFEDGVIRFLDELTPPGDTWRFLVVHGDEARALAVADAVNVNPDVALACPAVVADPGEPDVDCGCRTGSGAAPWAAVLGLVAVRRRRR